jgi:hypothetical protein
MARIFISYRRADSAMAAGRIYDHLTMHFGTSQVFMDIDTIEPGQDFVQVIETEVGSCNALLAVIGTQWLTVAHPDGTRRLDDPKDFTRLEIEIALQRNILIIPVLVNGASMPKPEDLPESIALLSRRNAMEVTNHRFRTDIDQLIKVLERVVKRAAQAAQKPVVPPDMQTKPVQRYQQPAQTPQQPAQGIHQPGQPAQPTPPPMYPVPLPKPATGSLARSMVKPAPEKGRASPILLMLLIPVLIGLVIAGVALSQSGPGPTATADITEEVTSTRTPNANQRTLSARFTGTAQAGIDGTQVAQDEEDAEDATATAQSRTRQTQTAVARARQTETAAARSLTQTQAALDQLSAVQATNAQRDRENAFATATAVEATRLASLTPIVLVDFIEQAPYATWSNGSELLTFGTESDRGSAIVTGDYFVEDGSVPIVLNTHPQWIDYGQVSGQFNLGFVVRRGDRFTAQIGFFMDGLAGDATWDITCTTASGTSINNQVSKAYSGVLGNLELDLSALEGEMLSTCTLTVYAGATAAQDWAVWVEPVIMGVPR